MPYIVQDDEVAVLLRPASFNAKGEWTGELETGLVCGAMVKTDVEAVSYLVHLATLMGTFLEMIQEDEGLYETEYDAILAGVGQGVGSYKLNFEVDLSTAQAGKIDKGIYQVGKAANSIWQYVPFFNVYRGSPANIAGGINYKVKVNQVDQPKIVFAANEGVSFRSEPEPTRDTVLPSKLREEIRESVGDILEEVLGDLLCEPERIVTRRAQDGTYSLLAGQAAGVTSGDQFILVRTAVWDSDRLDINDVAELALARVEFVYKNESAIKVIAGPNAPDSGSLIAIPF